MTDTYNFDQIIERHGTDSIKWGAYPEDVLPLWVADMDFRSPPAVIQALHQRVEHGVFGYAAPSMELRQVVVDRMDRLYGWTVEPDAIVFLPGVVTGLNQFCHAFSTVSPSVIVQTPVYPPFLAAPGNAGLQIADAPLNRTATGSYEMDFERLESRMKAGAKLFILCNPHNPVGRVFTTQELERVAGLCEKYAVTLCSDEIHSDLVFPGHVHTPIATISAEIEQRTITFLAPSKTYNVAGLDCALAVIPNPELRKQFESGNQGLVPHVNILGLTAALSAFRDGEDWLAELLVYLRRNREYLSDTLRNKLPEIGISPVEGTYLAWLDCRNLNLPDIPAQFFLNECRVGLNNGADFGELGIGFVRLNFGCPHTILEQALERMAEGINKYR